jgi:cytochrome c5
MGEHDDKVFLKRFGGIIAGLVIVTILIIIISVGRNQLEPAANPSREIHAAERVAPVGSVRTELPVEEAAAAEPDPVEPGSAESDPVEEVADSAADTTAELPAMADSGIDGAAIYNSACMACHASGAAGAPVPGSDDWAERAARGVDALAASAISGMGIMPPKGGRPDFSDDEIRAAVEHMLGQ